MSQTFHLCISVRWMLHWSNVEAKRNMRSITKSDGSHYLSVAEFRDALMDELARGHEVLPMGECEGFNYKTGCPGHETEKK
jgi:hypothetical protein